jgi:hypothetical protein
MPVPKHFRFTVRGIFDSSPETWVTGFHMTSTQPLSADAHLGDISESGVSAAVEGFFGGSTFCANAKVTDWRAYEIGNDGLMLGDGPLLHDYVASGPSGSAGAWKYPAQVACVISLIAAHRGPAKRGRMFLPAPAAPVGSGGRISDADAADIRTATTTFLKAVSDSIDMADTASSEGCNVSTGPPGSTTGTLQVIDHLEVGRVYDTIRSRRRSMLEGYSVGGHIDW